MSEIAEQLRQRVKNGGGISSADVASLVQESSGEKTGDEMEKTSVVQAEKPEHSDAADNEAAKEMDRKNFFFGILGALDSKGRTQITPEDKQAFVDAILANTRMQLKFSLFGGKLNFTIRSRTYEETRAAMHFASDEARGTFESQTVFSMRLRAMLMAMQVAEFNGTQYPTAGELGNLFTVKVDGKPIPPPWLKQTKTFEDLPEAVFEAVWQCIYEFEVKYWTLVRNSRNQDFWLPE